MTVAHLFIPLVALVAACSTVGPGDRTRLTGVAGRRFVSIREYRGWSIEAGAKPGETVYVSPEIDAGFEWNELIVSWNVPSSPTRYLIIEAQALLPEHATRWYTLGRWSEDPATNPRESVTKQKDDDGEVQTDTLALTHPAERLRLRVTSGGSESRESDPPPFLGLSFVDTRAEAPEESSSKRAWGMCLDVPERSQLSYEGGKVWCCPTSTSMVIGYWSKKLKRPALDRDVPLVAAGVFDPNWPGTGNWPFNTAYAGALPGIRAYVTRLSGLREIEEWVRAGVPVVCSVSYRLLYANEKSQSNGHVVVVIGFTETGDAIINDPWADFAKGDTARQTIPREHMAAACAKSKNTVFLIYPERWKIPRNRAGHWE